MKMGSLDAGVLINFWGNTQQLYDLTMIVMITMIGRYLEQLQVTAKCSHAKNK